MKMDLPMKLSALVIVALILVSVMSAFAAGLNLPTTNLERQSLPVTAEDIKPAMCDGLYLTNILSGSGTLTGTTSNDLIIGSANADTIDGQGGDDCIVAGNGDDYLIGGDGTDVCLGGPGGDTLDTTCETASQ